MHIISPLQQQTIAEAAFTPGHALQVGVQRKLASHLSACCSAGVDFIPIVAEALGSLVEDTIMIVRRLGEFITQCVGQDSPGSTQTPCKHLFHRLAIAAPCGGGMPACGYIASLPSPSFVYIVYPSLVLRGAGRVRRVRASRVRNAPPAPSAIPAPPTLITHGRLVWDGSIVDR